MNVIGHRGWAARYPDNSLEGILAARAVSAMVEVDVRRTPKGELVLSHDPFDDDQDLVLLDDLLAEIGDFPLNLEIKNFPGEPGFEPHHGTGLATAAQARPDDLLTCFFWPTVDEIHRNYPDVSTGVLVDRDWDLELAATHALAVGHRFLVPHWSLALAHPETIRQAVGQGLEVVVWTLNDSDLVPELAGLGVTAIITDDPGTMTAALKD
ncbi:MAG: glycerophosphodiester phosphodiesterase [Acidimicrobiia bacterium]